MRSGVLSILLGSFLVPSLAGAAIEPSATETVAASSTIAYKNNATNLFELRVYNNTPAFRDCRVQVSDGAYSCSSIEVQISLSAPGDRDDVFLIAASSLGGRHVIADACSGRLLQVSLSVIDQSYTAYPIVDQWTLETSSVDLQRPTAVVIHPSEQALLFSEGASITGWEWLVCNSEDPLQPPSGAVVYIADPWVVAPVDEERGSATLVLLEGGYMDGQLHPDTTRALAIYKTNTTAELWVVTGSLVSDEGEPRSAVFRRYDISGGGAPPLLGEWEIPTNVLHSLYPGHGGAGEPLSIAPFTDPSGTRLILAGSGGIVALSVPNPGDEIHYLGPLWLSFDRGAALQNAAEVISLTHALDGSRIHALFSSREDAEAPGGNRGTLLAYWDADAVPSEPSAQLIVQPGDENGGCLPVDAGLFEWSCGTVSSALISAWWGQSIVVEDGVYPELAYFYGRPLNLVASEVGRAALFGVDGLPVAAFEDVPVPGASIDGLILSGGNREFQVGPSSGGAVVSVDSHAALSRTLLIGNYAERGGSIAVFGNGTFSVADSAILDNSAGAEAAVVYADGDGDLLLDFAYVTIAGNCVTDVSGGVFVARGAQVAVASSIVSMNHDEGRFVRSEQDSEVTFDETLIYAFDEPLDEAELTALGEGNISGDPRFEDLSQYNVIPLEGSPAYVGGGQLGVYGGALGVDLGWWLDFLDPIEFGCPLPSLDGDDDDAVDDYDAVVVLPSGLRCDCDADLAASPGSAGSFAFLLALAILGRRRSAAP
jgi:hypothetical protein